MFESPDSRFSSPYPVPEPELPELPRDAFDPLVDASSPLDPLELLDPLIPPELPMFPDPDCELLSVLELPDDPDELWSFLFRSFAIRPPARFGRTDYVTAIMRSNVSAA